MKMKYWSKMKRILCIGDIILDILPAPFPISKEKILDDGETFVNSITFQRGGCGGNFVCVLKSIFPEADVNFVSRIANDSNSDFLIKEMEKYGVTQRFVRDSTVKCQITIAVSFNDGERHFVTYLGGLANFCIEDITDGMFEGVDHLAYRGIWFAEKLLLKAEQFLQKAKSKRIPISMDLGFDPFWNEEKKSEAINYQIKLRKEATLNSLKYITYLFGNEKEFLNLTDQKKIEVAIRILLNSGVRTIIMHRGSKGAAIIQAIKSPEPLYEYIEIPAVKIKVINPVGSGDTFDSIFIAQVLEGKTPVDAAKFASAGAALSLQSPPGTKITLEAVKNFIETQPELMEPTKPQIK